MRSLFYLLQTIEAFPDLLTDVINKINFHLKSQRLKYLYMIVGISSQSNYLSEMTGLENTNKNFPICNEHLNQDH